MDQDTVHCAYRLAALIANKQHPSSRTIDAATRELVSLTLDSAATQYPSPLTDTYNPDAKEVKEQLKLFAAGIHGQVSKVSKVDNDAITSAVTKAIDTCFAFKLAEEPASQTTATALDKQIKALEQQVQTLKEEVQHHKDQVAIVLKLKSAPSRSNAPLKPTPYSPSPPRLPPRRFTPSVIPIPSGVAKKLNLKSTPRPRASSSTSSESST